MNVPSWHLRYMKFQLTAARRRLDGVNMVLFLIQMFQLTAARRRLAHLIAAGRLMIEFQLTAARRRLVDVSLF